MRPAVEHAWVSLSTRSCDQSKVRGWRCQPLVTIGGYRWQLSGGFSCLCVHELEPATGIDVCCQTTQPHRKHWGLLKTEKSKKKFKVFQGKYLKSVLVIYVVSLLLASFLWKTQTKRNKNDTKNLIFLKLPLNVNFESIFSKRKPNEAKTS